MSTKACGTWEKEVVMESLPRELVTILKDIGSMTKDKVKDHTFSVRRTRYLLDNGLMIPQKQEFIHK